MVLLTGAPAATLDHAATVRRETEAEADRSGQEPELLMAWDGGGWGKPPLDCFSVRGGKKKRSQCLGLLQPMPQESQTHPRGQQM
jgi:hypothetical protein